MEEPPPTTDQSLDATKITDLDVDSLAHCATHLSLSDVSNMAMSCKSLNRVAYSDSIWQHLFRDQWPGIVPSSFSQTTSARNAYLDRHTAVQQFKFKDPLRIEINTDAKPFDHLFLDKYDIIFSQGSLIRSMKIDGSSATVNLSDHSAQITCMRFFPLLETSLFRNETQRNDNVMVTSSSDCSIRLWWKGKCQRCFKGHNSSVTTLSDKLLGDNGGKIFASGGEDNTVRLWSLGSSGKHGQHALKSTLYGHTRPLAFMAVAGHKTSLLVSISRDSKVRVWDTNASSAVRSSCCVGSASMSGIPIGIKCDDSLAYIAAGCSVVAIDLRTMQRVLTISNQPELHAFEVMPSKSLLCTGGKDRAMLWDIRRSSDTRGAQQPLEKLEGHKGPVKHLHMDSYKIVTGGPDDSYVQIWDVGTGKLTNSCQSGIVGCSAMAVRGSRIATASCGVSVGLIKYRDYSFAKTPVSDIESSNETVPSTSKFFHTEADDDYSDGDYSDDEDDYDQINPYL